MRNIRRIINLLVAGLLTLLVFTHISYMYRSYTKLMGFYGMKKNMVDVIFVGTSITFCSFMPMEAWNEYGIAAFDYCPNVQFENTMDNSLKEIRKTQNPKLIMVDISPFIHGHYAGNTEWADWEQDMFIKYNLDSMRYSWNRIELVSEINKDIKGNISSFMRYYFDIERNHQKKPSIRQINNSLHDIEYGYGYLERTPNFLDNYELVENDGIEVELTSREQYYLDELLETADQMKCDVVFYCAPQLFVSKDAMGRKNYIERVIVENGGVFWDFSKEMEEVDFDLDMDYWGYNHFDSLGAEKSTKMIANKILQNYDIPDRRGDAKYKQYDDDYSDWLKIKENYNQNDFSRK